MLETWRKNVIGSGYKRNPPSDSENLNRERTILDRIIKNADLNGVGGECAAAAAIAINEELFKGAGQLILFANKTLWEMRKKLEGNFGGGHVVVKYLGKYWDSIGITNETLAEDFAFASSSQTPVELTEKQSYEFVQIPVSVSDLDKWFDTSSELKMKMILKREKYRLSIKKNPPNEAGGMAAFEHDVIGNPAKGRVGRAVSAERLEAAREKGRLLAAKHKAKKFSASARAEAARERGRLLAAEHKKSAVSANPRRRRGRGMGMASFIKENKAEIDAAIKSVSDVRLNDKERRMWIMNDEGLYRWARSCGVRI